MLHDPVEFETITVGKYSTRFSKNENELREVFRLRFQVFNEELGEGFQSSFETGIDTDKFDPQHKHLVVVDNESGAIIGTYRLQTCQMAENGIGFYTEEEFYLGSLPRQALKQGVEVGRACIAEAHRNGKALFALWRGLSEFMRVNKKRYFFGCASLTGTDATVAQDTLNYLASKNYLRKDIILSPKPEFLFTPPIIEPSGNAINTQLPSLFLSYLKYGGHICSLPACDKKFNTTDFVVLFDLDLVPEKKYKLFYGTTEKFFNV